MKNYTKAHQNLIGQNRFYRENLKKHTHTKCTHIQTHTHYKEWHKNKADDRFSVGNSASKKTMKQHLQSIKENCQSKFCIQWAYLPKTKVK